MFGVCLDQPAKLQRLAKIVRILTGKNQLLFSFSRFSEHYYSMLSFSSIRIGYSMFCVVYGIYTRERNMVLHLHLIG